MLSPVSIPMYPRPRTGLLGGEREGKEALTQCIRTQVFIAMHTVPVRLVERRIARHVLGLLLVLVLVSASASTAAAAEHLVEEAELRCCLEGREKGQEEEG